MKKFSDFYQERFIVQSAIDLKPIHPILTPHFVEALDFLYDPESTIKTRAILTTKKSGKSSLLAGLLLDQAIEFPESEHYIYGTSFESGKDRVLETILYALRKSDIYTPPNDTPYWRQLDDRIILENGSRIRISTSSAKSTAGSNYKSAAVDEVWAISTRPEELRFAEMAVPPGGSSFRTLASYAGIKNESVVLKSLWDNLKAGVKHPTIPCLYVNEELSLAGIIDDGEDGKYYYRLPHVTDAEIQSELLSAPYRQSAERMWLNKWSSEDSANLISEQDFVSMQDSELLLI